MLATVQRHLAQQNAQGYLVGGAVRDALLDRPIEDLDVAVAVDPKALADALRSPLAASVVALDERRRTFRLVLGRGRGEPPATHCGRFRRRIMLSLNESNNL
ncbi:MAG: hypothetical protein IIC20_05075 [Chloroflexi bacterium]|nr:hypothetical protein [Chloroflexota bacterium]